MFISLIYGKEVLEEQQVYRTIKKWDGSFEKKKNGKIIALKEIHSKNIEIGIGHSLSESMTFLPHFVSSKNDKGITYSDMPGLMDTGGDMMEYINMFMIKAIF